jgi:hypothetical protein
VHGGEEQSLFLGSRLEVKSVPAAPFVGPDVLQPSQGQREAHSFQVLGAIWAFGQKRQKCMVQLMETFASEALRSYSWWKIVMKSGFIVSQHGRKNSAVKSSGRDDDSGHGCRRAAPACNLATRG